MNQKLLLVLAGGVAVMAGTVWLTYPPPPKSVGDPSRYKFMHCPECEREQPYDRIKFDQPCLYCEKRLIGTEDSIKQRRAGSSPFGLMVTVLGAELVALMAAVLFWAHPRPKLPEEEYLYINCERCGQKIRYREEQIGQMAMCRRCKRPFIYPDAAEDDE